jgi:hypothetical protein
LSVLRRPGLEHDGADDAPQTIVLKLHTPYPDMGAVGERF